MVDMLVALYAIAPSQTPLPAGVSIRRALAPERRAVVGWVERQFGAGWAGECEAAFAATPTRCLIAVQDRALLGFAVWDVTALGFFGPTGVAEGTRGQGVGAALLLSVLEAMRAAGYGYAIIGAAGAPAFFSKIAGAVPIADSRPGLYHGLLKA